MLDQDQQRRWA